METTEKIVEAYCRYVRGWFTIPNIKCSGQYEIDLLAIEPKKNGGLNRYHIESGVSISGTYSELTAKKFSTVRLRKRGEQAGQRRTVGYFSRRKFGAKEILERLKDYGYHDGNYKKIVVTWGWTTEAKILAEREQLELWDFRDLMRKVAEGCGQKKTYFSDDTLRTLQLFKRST